MRIGALPDTSGNNNSDTEENSNAIVAQEVEVDTELSGISNVPTNSVIFMYFQIQSQTDLGTYTGGSCQLSWLGRDTEMRTIDMMDSELTVRSYYGELDFT